MSEPSFWWEKELEDPEDSTVHEMLFPYVRDVEERQKDIHQANLEHAKLYSSRELSVIDWGLLNLRSGISRLKPVSENVTQSVVDAAEALIAKNRPKATVSTDGGDFTIKQKAKKLDKFLFGEFRRLDVYERCTEAFKDSCVFGTGCVKVFADDNSIVVERIMPDEIIVDEREAVSGDPIQVHHRKLVDREALKAMFPDMEEAIDLAQTHEDFSWTSFRTSPVSMIIVIESWRIPLKEDKSDGRHSICIENATLFDERWERSGFPIEFYCWSKPLAGFYGQGIVERLAGIQLQINKLNRHIDRAQHLVATPRFLVPHGSRIKPEHINNSPGTIIYYTGVQQPTVWVGQAVNAETFNRLESLKRSAFEIAGISQLSAQSKKPVGLESGAALREYNDINTDRFAIQAQNYEAFILKIAEQIINVAKEIYPDADPETVWNSQDMTEKIKWSDIDLDKDRFSLGLEPSSILTKTPAGRKQDVGDLLGMQAIDPTTALYLMGNKDVDRHRDLETAQHTDAERTVELLLEMKFPVPEPFQNLQLVFSYVQNTYLSARAENAPEEVLQNLRDWMEQADDVMNPPPVPGVGPVPGDQIESPEEAAAMAAAAGQEVPVG